MPTSKAQQHNLTIGQIATRTGLAITAIRFYEEESLVFPVRNNAGQRRYSRGDIRRLSFVKVCQNLGFSLADVRQALLSLPDQRTPTRKDWDKLSRHFIQDIDSRIANLQLLRDNLSGCIGCGCLSMSKCRLYNPNDKAAQFGSGPRYLMGDPSVTNGSNGNTD